MTGRILVVDDDTALAEMIGIVLRSDGFEPVFCDNGDKAVEAFRTEKPDVILLDLMLPGKAASTCAGRSGRSPVCPSSCSPRSPTPSTWCSGSSPGPTTTSPSRSSRASSSRGCGRGSVGQPRPAALIHIGDLEIDVTGHRVTRAGEAIPLTPLEFDVLVALARPPGQVFTREVLLEDVWGYRHAADTRLVNVHIQRLRAKIENDPENPEIVLTVRGRRVQGGRPGA